MADINILKFKNKIFTMLTTLRLDSKQIPNYWTEVNVNALKCWLHYSL